MPCHRAMYQDYLRHLVWMKDTTPGVSSERMAALSIPIDFNVTVKEAHD